MELIKLKDFSNLSKKELQERGKIKAIDLMVDLEPVVLMVQARKAIEYLSAMVKELDYETRKDLMEQYSNEANIYGSNLSLSSTGDRLDFDEDLEYTARKMRMKEREELLRLARKAKEDIFDEDGVKVPKVPLKSPSKEVLKIKL